MNSIVNLGPHAAFIWAAYGIALLVLIALIAWIALDHRALRRQVNLLESQGMTRRSSQASNRPR